MNDEWPEIGCCFTRASLGNSNQVSAWQSNRNRLWLNRCRCRVLAFDDNLHELIIKSKVTKGTDRLWCIWSKNSDAKLFPQFKHLVSIKRCDVRVFLVEVFVELLILNTWVVNRRQGIDDVWSSNHDRIAVSVILNTLSRSIDVLFFILIQRDVQSSIRILSHELVVWFLFVFVVNIISNSFQFFDRLLAWHWQGLRFFLLRWFTL